jgi:molecular chaperone DnaK (HSP70)
MLMELTGITPRQEVHPDLCVALGAGVLASRLAGHEVERILVDINPYSFGISYLGDRGGFTYPYCYKPIIHRNTPLPVTRTSRYFTAVPCQEKAEINVFQGDDPDALRNVMIGRFTVEDLTPTREPNEVLCQMKLDLDGILNVSAIEKVTGKTKHVTIADALVKKSPEEIGAARRQLNALFDRQLGDEDEDEDEDEEDQEAASTQLETAAETATWSDAGRLSPDPDDELEEGHGIPSDAETGDAEWTRAVATAEQLVGRSRELLPRMHDEDKEDAIELHTRIAEASRARDQDELARAMEELRELMYFVDGR